ncbi:MAG TPA: DUF3017 domain-containing protein [Jatrophihabitans sp.]
MLQTLLRQRAFVAILVLIAAAVIYLVASPDHWRRGSFVIGIAMLVAGLLRATLPARDVGLLAVRGRWRDTAIYVVLGVIIVGAVIRLG